MSTGVFSMSTGVFRAADQSLAATGKTRPVKECKAIGLPSQSILVWNLVIPNTSVLSTGSKITWRSEVNAKLRTLAHLELCISALNLCMKKGVVKIMHYFLAGRNRTPMRPAQKQ